MARNSSGPDKALAAFDSLPDSAFVRLPTVAALFATSTATVWRRVKSGQLPAPVKLGPQISAWRVGELRAVLASLANTAA
jgi:predicted DNA-binding transcriptional regulator AlpA